MDEDGLPIVGPGIDYTKVECINQKRLIAFLNHFVTHTTGFLNRFSCVCEEKLENLSHRLQQLEVTMNLLDAKINSIPGFENMTAPSSATAAPTADTAAPPAAPAGPPAAPGAAPPAPGANPAPAAPADPAAPPAPPAPPAEVKVENPVSKDRRYIKYFKMQQVGVPEPVLRMKMTQEGLDPDMLDTPDAPAPSGGTKDPENDDFSDDGDQSDDSDDFD